MRTLNDLLATLSPDAKARALAEGERLSREYRTLQDIRKMQKVTQVELAKALGVNQATISTMEKRRDVRLSTLDRVVSELGGRVHVVVEFDDRDPVFLKTADDPREPTAPTPWARPRGAG